MAKILIVDDVPANIKVLGRLLKEHHQLMVASNGEKASFISTGITTRVKLRILLTHKGYWLKVKFQNYIYKGIFFHGKESIFRPCDLFSGQAAPGKGNSGRLQCFNRLF